MHARAGQAMNVRQVLRLSNRLPWRRGRRGDVMADDESHEVIAGEARCRATSGHAPVTQHSNVVSDGEDFIKIM